MLKELFLAIILGALLGFGLTGGYLAINKKNNPNKNITTIVTPTPQSIENISTKETIPPKEEGFSFIGIEDMDVVSKENLTINGTTTSPNNTIIATLGDQIINSTSGEDAKFSLQIKLTSGLNNIKITVIDSSSNQFEKDINITYSTATI